MTIVATPTLPNPAACDLAVMALDQALDRLDAAVQRDDYPGHLIPLFEALAWLYGLHNYFRKMLGDGAYFARCRDEPNGRVLVALMYARGFVAHELTDLTLRWQGTGGRGIEWIDRDYWRGPADPEAGDDVYCRDALYDELVADQALSDPLRRAQAFVASLS